MIKYREAQDTYGLHAESRRKVQEYLGLLESELTRSLPQYEEEPQEKSVEAKKTNTYKLKLSLQTIKEDIFNEDKASTIRPPREPHVQHSHSHSNSEGV
jgi:hypothetical protein